MPNDAPGSDELTGGERDSSLDQCPVCRYSLRGLPAAHRCPECGFEYDEHTRVWTLSRFGALRSFGSVVFIVCGVNLIGQLQMMRFRFPLRVSLQMTIAVLVFVILCVTWRSRPFIAVTPKGILTRWGWRTHTSDWIRIDRAGDYEANVFVKKFNYGPVEYARFLPNKEAQAEFRRAVNEGKARYDPPPDLSTGLE